MTSWTVYSYCVALMYMRIRNNAVCAFIALKIWIERVLTRMNKLNIIKYYILK